MFRIFQRLRWVYLSVFGIQVVPMSAVIIWRETETGGHTNFFDILIASLQKIDDVCYLALITSVIIVDIGRYLLGILIEAPQDRAYERGLGQGKSQERARWVDYDRRMREWSQSLKESRDTGEPFDEPPPEPPSGDS